MNASYLGFQASLYPFLPFLYYEAYKVRKTREKLPSLSESLSVGKGIKKILILGESTAAGVGASSPEKSLGSRIHHFLKNDSTVKILGKNGLKVSEVLPTFSDQLEKINGDYEGIFLFLGGNDCFRLTHPQNYRSELQKLIRTLEEMFSPHWIYLADIPPVYSFPAFSPFVKYFMIRQRKFLQREMKKISMDNPKVIFDEISLNLNPDFFSRDGIHPSDCGYEEIAKFAIDGLKRRGL
ncbi:GDSL-type esterase/lipase family protein [Algoriphagus sp. CAU 1675]|uniref:GDSL-type esterase/lipase family protein n=1 Tax=Algoriphagus sp. CAU 1675 TaxID=3032597 RepID=UPI0023DA1CAF|nr:GDSL-type esterase/lipase family protein [Algoriphagus sp. CAU 1675]MDF2158057.1 GDSL-type esterase/lipase family protein [Algoriphagus sp. CAU 1675]